MKKSLLFLLFSTFLPNQLNAKPQKIPVYTFYTPSHQKLKDEWFLPSLKDDFDLHITYIPQEGAGEFGQKDYCDAILKKVDLIIDAIKQNYNGIFIYSDVDIQFFRPIEKIVLKKLNKYDMLIQRDTPGGKVCAGFFITRANEATLNLWRYIKNEMIQAGRQSDQEILNEVLVGKQPELPISWDYLPKEFMGGGSLTGKLWSPGDELPIPHGIIMHHANWTVGIPHKIAQLEYVKRNVQAHKSLMASWQEQLEQKIQNNDFPVWMLKQVEQDLKPFLANKEHSSSLDTSHFPQTNRIDEKGDQIGGHCLIRIEIKDNIVYAPADGCCPAQMSRKKYVIQALNDLTSCTTLQDTVFFLDLSDGYTYYHQEPAHSCPIFAFSKDAHHEKIILFPDPQNLSGRLSEWDNDPAFFHLMYPESKAASAQHPWHSKKEKMVWRGSNSDIFTPAGIRSPRFTLCKLSSARPDLIDAGFTHFYGKQFEQKKCKPFKKAPLTLQEHVGYKYQIVLDGATTSWSRAYWQLLSNCVVFKQDSRSIQWYYGALKPFVHYIPVKNDLSNLIQHIEWAKQHDQEAHTIAQNATKFAERHLNYESQLLYIYLLLKKYSEIPI